MSATVVEIDMMHRSPVTDCLHYGIRAECKVGACVAALTPVSEPSSTSAEA